MGEEDTETRGGVDGRDGGVDGRDGGVDGRDDDVADVASATARIDEQATQIAEQSSLIASLQREIEQTNRGMLELTIEAEANYRRLFEHAIEGIFQVSRDGRRFRLANPAMTAMLGYDSAENLLTSVMDVREDVFVDPARFDDCMATLESEGSISEFEFRARRHDGTVRWLACNLTALLDDGTLTGYRGSAVDITERKQHERDLRLFSKAVGQAGHSIMITNADGVIEYVNPAFEEVTGFSRAEAIGRTPRILKSGRQDRAFYAAMWGTITAGETWTSEIVNRRRDGELYDAAHTITPITNADGETTHYLTIETDITERKHREQHLTVLHRVLRHNLLTAVNVIRGNADELAARIDDPLVGPQLEAIRRRTLELEKLAHNANHIREVLQGGAEQTHPRDVVALLERRLPQWRAEYPDVTFTLDGPEVAVGMTTSTLERALDELVENAATHNDAPEPRIEFTVVPANEYDQVAIVIADNGPGMPRYERDVIETGGETPLKHSSGVGLWMVYWIVNGQGGELGIAENDPHGSRVSLRLPGGLGRPTVDEPPTEDGGERR